MRNLFWLCLFACAGPAAESAPPPPPTSKSIEEFVHEPVGEGPAATSQAKKGIIARSQLLPILDGGPGAFLAHVDVTPRFSDGRFQGWRLVRLFAGDDRFAGVDLQPGDVILRVNGRSVEKPDQLMEVWQSLRAAPALELELLRDGAPMKLRWPITESSGP